jgi:hypothetical protein
VVVAVVGALPGQGLPVEPLGAGVVAAVLEHPSQVVEARRAPRMVLGIGGERLAVQALRGVQLAALVAQPAEVVGFIATWGCRAPRLRRRIASARSSSASAPARLPRTRSERARLLRVTATCG